jgi:hypothetical protein
VAVHVVPKGAEAKPELVAATVSTTTISDKSKPATGSPAAAQVVASRQVPAVEITLRNAGTKYLYLQDLEYMATGVSQSGTKVDLPRWDQNAVIDAAGVTLVEPGAERVFKLPLEGVPALKSVQVEIRQRPKL